MSVLLDENGAQLLPNVGDERRIATMHQAQMVISADLRVKSEAWRDLAERVTVIR